jgi:hypothetical protein
MNYPLLTAHCLLLTNVMTFTTISVIAGVVLLAIFFLIAKMAIRWAVRVGIVVVILVALLGAGGFWWWSSRLTDKPKTNRQPSAPGRRGSAP